MDVFKTPADSVESLRVPAFPAYVNSLGHVEAGYVLKLIDITACLPVLRHLGPGYSAVTACVDRTNFMSPIRRWELIVLTGRLTQVWQSSAETEVTLESVNYRTGDIRPIATANLVLVGFDSRRQKIRMPGLQAGNAGDEQRMQAADQRKADRQHESGLEGYWPLDPEQDQSVALSRLMTASDANLFNNVFGGVLLDIIDEAGRKAAQRQVLGGTVVGVRLDRMSFLAPAFIGEIIHAQAAVTQTWLTSMEIQVDVYAENPTQPGHRTIATAYLVYVGVDPDGAPAQVPSWQPQTDIARQRADAANQRREKRRLDTLGLGG